MLAHAGRAAEVIPFHRTPPPPHTPLHHAEVSPVSNPTSVAFSDTDARAGLYGGTVTIGVPASEADVTFYSLWWGSSTTLASRLSGAWRQGGPPTPISTPSPLAVCVRVCAAAFCGALLHTHAGVFLRPTVVCVCVHTVLRVFAVWA